MRHGLTLLRSNVRTRLCAVALCSALLGACASGPPPGAPDVERSAGVVAAAEENVECHKWAGPGGVSWDGSVGTLADPYGGLTELAANLGPGQTGCIVPGTTFYPDERTLGAAQSGTPQAKKVIRSGPGARATLLGTIGVNASDVVFRDLNFRPLNAGTGRLLAVSGDRVEFRDNDISHPWNICVQIGVGQATTGASTLVEADDVIFDGNEVHHCGNQAGDENGEDIGGSGWHAFYVQEGSGIRITNNLIYQGGYRGLQVYPNAKNVEIAHNIFDGSASNLNLGHLVLGDTLYIAENVDIHHNIISNARLSPAHDKNPAQVHGNMPPDGNTRGNVVRNNCMWFDDPTLQADLSKHFSGYGYAVSNNVFANPGYADRAAFDFSRPPGGPCAGMGPVSDPVAGPELEVSLTRLTEYPRLGRPLIFRATVANVGDAAATGVDLVHTLDESFGAMYGETSKGVCLPVNGFNDMHCQIGQLAPAETVVVHIGISPQSVGNKYIASVGYAANADQASSGYVWTEIGPAVTDVDADFDGDGDADIAVYRPGGNGWFVQGGLTTGWGATGDVAVLGDFNGDGRADPAVFRPSDRTWHVQPNNGWGGLSTQWGLPGDVPIPADFNGDGITDIAVFRPSDQTWYVRPSGSFPQGLATQWGVFGDVPIPADFDGDGRDEVAVFRPSDQTWYSQGSDTATGLATQWGVPGDVPVPVDFDGDGCDEVAVFRPSDQTWYSQSSGLATQWGKPGDRAVPGDYDGDGDADVAVFRPSDQTWYVRGGLSTQWGTSGDVAVIVSPALRGLY